MTVHVNWYDWKQWCQEDWEYQYEVFADSWTLWISLITDVSQDRNFNYITT